MSTFERFPELLSEQVDKVRDRTAEAMSADGASVLRELGKLSSRFDELGEDLDDRLEVVEETLLELTDELSDPDDGGRGTTWPRRLFWIAVGAGIGVGVAHLTDPDRGQARREHLVGAAQTRADEVAREATARAQDVRSQVEASGQRVAEEAKQAATAVGDEASAAVDDVRDQVETSAERLVDDATPSEGGATR